MTKDRKSPKETKKEKVSQLTNHVVGNAGREGNDTHRGVKKLKLGQDTTQNRKGRNGNSHTDEEHKHGESDVYNPLVTGKLVIQSPGNTASHGKRDGETTASYRCGNSPIAHEEADVRFQADDEEVQHQTEVGDKGQVGEGFGGEDGLSEARNAPHHGGAEQDAADDFGDDAGLADFGEGPVEHMADDQDKTGLHERAGI